MVDLFVDIVLVGVFAFADGQHVFDIPHPDLKVGSAELDDSFSKPQQVQSQLIAVFFCSAILDDLFKDDFQIFFVHPLEQTEQTLQQVVRMV